MLSASHSLRRALQLTALTGVTVLVSSKFRSAAARPATDAEVLKIREMSAGVSRPVVWGALSGSLTPVALSTKCVKDMAVCRHASIVIDEANRVSVLLRLGNATHAIDLPYFNNVTPIQVACSQSAAYVLTDKGVLFEVALPSWRSSTPTGDGSADEIAPTPVPLPVPTAAECSVIKVDLGKQRVVKVRATSAGNVAVVTDAGQVFTKGNNEHGQLGQRTSTPFSAVFAPVYTSLTSTPDDILLAERPSTLPLPPPAPRASVPQ